VTGSNFLSGASVQWNGSARTTTFVSASQLTATIGSADIAAAGTAQVKVANPDGSVSNALPFTITAPSYARAPCSGDPQTVDQTALAHRPRKARLDGSDQSGRAAGDGHSSGSAKPRRVRSSKKAVRLAMSSRPVLG
jgi:hypothetical protein